MTILELQHIFDSKRRTNKRDAQEKATYYYRLADLIGMSVGRIHSSSNTFPPISDIFPELFDSEEIQEQLQAKKDELSAARFKQFAQSFNKKFTDKKEEANNS